MKALVASSVGVVLSVGVAIHEWQYHQAHKYATGVSGVIVVLALAVACGCFAAGSLAWSAHQREVEAERAFMARASLHQRDDEE